MGTGCSSARDTGRPSCSLAPSHQRGSEFPEDLSTRERYTVGLAPPPGLAPGHYPMSGKKSTVLEKVLKSPERHGKGGHAIEVRNTGFVRRPTPQDVSQTTRTFSPLAHYPMYVMQVSDFLLLNPASGLPRHEEAMARGLLKEVEEIEPGMYTAWSVAADGSRNGVSHEVLHRAKFIAVSHQWMRPSRDPSLAHPDSAEHVKFNSLSLYLRRQQSPEEDDVGKLLWMDWLSIPQDCERRFEQIQAIKSLPAYFLRASNILVLSVSKEAYSNKDHGYISRGHCLLELCTSKLPRLDIFGKWYVPGFEVTGLWGKLQVLFMDSGEISAIKWEDFQNAGSPLKGNFTNPDDKEHLRPLVQEYVALLKVFQEKILDPVRCCASWTEVGRTTDFFTATSFRNYWAHRPSSEWLVEDEGLGKEEDSAVLANRLDWSPADWCETILPSDYVRMMEHSAMTSQMGQMEKKALLLAEAEALLGLVSPDTEETPANAKGKKADAKADRGGSDAEETPAKAKGKTTAPTPTPLTPLTADDPSYQRIPGLTYRSGANNVVKSKPHTLSAGTEWYLDKDAPFAPDFSDKTVRMMPLPTDDGLISWGQPRRDYTLKDWKELVAHWEETLPKITDEHKNSKWETAAYRGTQTNDSCIIQALFDGLPSPIPSRFAGNGRVHKLLNHFKVDMYGNVICLPDKGKIPEGRASNNSLTFFDVDHIFPFSRGGRSVMRNFAPVQYHANRAVKVDNLLQTLDPVEMCCGLMYPQLLGMVDFVLAEHSAQRNTTQSNFDSIVYWLTRAPVNGGSFGSFQRDVGRSLDGRFLMQYFNHLSATPERMLLPGPGPGPDGPPALRMDPGPPPLQVRFSLSHVEIFGDCTRSVIETLKARGFSYEGQPRFLWKKPFKDEAERASVLGEVERICQENGFVLVQPANLPAAVPAAAGGKASRVGRMIKVSSGAIAAAAAGANFVAAAARAVFAAAVAGAEAAPALPRSGMTSDDAVCRASVPALIPGIFRQNLADVFESASPPSDLAVLDLEDSGGVSISINRSAADKIMALQPTPLTVTLNPRYFSTIAAEDKDILAPTIFFEPSGVVFSEGDVFVCHLPTYLSYSGNEDLAAVVAATAVFSTTEAFQARQTAPNSAGTFSYPDPSADTYREEWARDEAAMAGLPSAVLTADKERDLIVLNMRVSHFSGSTFKVLAAAAGAVAVGAVAAILAPRLLTRRYTFLTAFRYKAAGCAMALRKSLPIALFLIQGDPGQMVPPWGNWKPTRGNDPEIYSSFSTSFTSTAAPMNLECLLTSDVLRAEVGDLPKTHVVRSDASTNAPDHFFTHEDPLATTQQNASVSLEFPFNIHRFVVSVSFPQLPLINTHTHRHDFFPRSGDVVAYLRPPVPLPEPLYDVFLAHSWDKERVTHEDVSVIYRILSSKGLSVFLDSEAMPAGNLKHGMHNGLMRSKSVLAFITSDYLQKLATWDPDVNCFFEALQFLTAEHLKAQVVPVVLKPAPPHRLPVDWSRADRLLQRSFAADYLFVKETDYGDQAAFVDELERRIRSLIQ